jgi:hypothetical protein
MAKETTQQLKQIIDLLDNYPEITSAAAAVIYDWLNGKDAYTNDNWVNMTRHQQAQQFIEWFEDQINNRGNL